MSSNSSSRKASRYPGYACCYSSGWAAFHLYQEDSWGMASQPESRVSWCPPQNCSGWGPNGPDTDSFEPSRAVHHWYSTAHRNPDNSLYRRSVMCYLSCIFRLPVYIVCIVRAFLYLPALQMFSNLRTVFILTLRLCTERPFSNNVVFLSNKHNGYCLFWYTK